MKPPHDQPPEPADEPSAPEAAPFAAAPLDAPLPVAMPRLGGPARGPTELGAPRRQRCRFHRCFHRHRHPLRHCPRWPQRLHRRPPRWHLHRPRHPHRFRQPRRCSTSATACTATTGSARTSGHHHLRRQHRRQHHIAIGVLISGWRPPDHGGLSSRAWSISRTQRLHHRKASVTGAADCQGSIRCLNERARAAASSCLPEWEIVLLLQLQPDPTRSRLQIRTTSNN